MHVEPPAAPADPPGRWRALAVIGTGMLLAFSPWFSAAAVAPLLAADWHTSGLELTFLAVAVQIGFAVGALVLAATGATDVLPGPLVFCAGAAWAAGANLLFALVPGDAASALPFRALTGLGMAAVYPVGVKMIAGWFRVRRGLAIGVMTGAITVGSALPHLFRAVGALAGTDWRAVVAFASAAGLLGGLIVLLGARSGPLETSAPRFSLSVAAAAWREPPVRYAEHRALGALGGAVVTGAGRVSRRGGPPAPTAYSSHRCRR